MNYYNEIKNELINTPRDITTGIINLLIPYGRF